MEQDDLIAEVRTARREISAECDHDLWKLYERYKALQESLRSSARDKLQPPPPEPVTALCTPAVPQRGQDGGEARHDLVCYPHLGLFVPALVTPIELSAEDSP
jgi:hypothetical protein